MSPRMWGWTGMGRSTGENEANVPTHVGVDRGLISPFVSGKGRTSVDVAMRERISQEVKVNILHCVRGLGMTWSKAGEIVGMTGEAARKQVARADRDRPKTPAT